MTARTIRHAFILCAAAGGTALTAAPAQAAEPITVTIDAATIGSAPGTVDITGTVTCATSADAFIFGEVRQVQGWDIAQDFYFTENPVPCSSVPTVWTATTAGADRVFLPLVTDLTATATSCVDEVSCYTGTGSARLVLS